MSAFGKYLVQIVGTTMNQERTTTEKRKKGRKKSAFKNASAFAIGSLAGGFHCLVRPGQTDLSERAFAHAASGSRGLAE